MKETQIMDRHFHILHDPCDGGPDYYVAAPTARLARRLARQASEQAGWHVGRVLCDEVRADCLPDHGPDLPRRSDNR